MPSAFENPNPSGPEPERAADPGSWQGWDLTGHTALVTAGAAGIGAAVANTLAAMGARVIIADIDLDSATRTAHEIAGTAQPLPVDLDDPASINRLANRVHTEYGGCDIVVNNGGAAVVERFLDSTPETWDRLYRINQRAAMQITQELVPAMIERGYGRLVYISSDGARAGSSGEAAYAGAKASLFGFAKSLARELAQSSVTANVVCPGPTNTAMTAEHMRNNPRLLGKLERSIPLRRLGEPHEVAGAVGWLASPAASYVTGQIISVSGGITMQ